MRIQLTAVIVASCLATTAMAQGAGGGSVPSEIGNRAQGKDYQPTPGGVAPREKAAGVQPPAAQQKATNQDLERMDKNLLRDEGLSTKSVPKLTTGK